MKKHHAITVVMIAFHFSVLGQLTVLFVNDNAVNTANTETMIMAMNHSGYAYDVFDAVAQQRSPTYTEMAAYDLVFWYMSSDGVGLYFWNGTEQDNIDLALYLMQGGWIVALGTDFLYDRYTTPSTFYEGDFVHDFLGTQLYHAQSYGDDGGLGVSQLDLEPGSTIMSLNPVVWTFNTLWWVDACLPAEGAVPVYRMGPQSYLFSDYFSGIFYETQDFKTLSFFFDPALIDTEANRNTFVSDILNYFDTILELNEISDDFRNTISITPNPANDFVYVAFVGNQNKLIRQQISILDFSGKMVKEPHALNISQNQIRIDVSGLSPGSYFLHTDTGNAAKFVVTR